MEKFLKLVAPDVPVCSTPIRDGKTLKPSSLNAADKFGETMEKPAPKPPVGPLPLPVKTVTLVPFARGNVPSFFKRTEPSPVSSSFNSRAACVASS